MLLYKPNIVIKNHQLVFKTLLDTNKSNFNNWAEN